MLSLIGFTDGVHMMVQIRKQRALGMLPRNATKKGLRDVGLACFLTLLTTSLDLRRSLGPITRSFGSLDSAASSESASLYGGHFGHTTSDGKSHGKPTSSRARSKHRRQELAKIVVGVDFVIKHAKVMSWIGIVSTLVMAALRCSFGRTIAFPMPCQAGVNLNSPWPLSTKRWEGWRSRRSM